MNWRDDGRLANWRAEIQLLDRVLSAGGFPALEQVEPPRELANSLTMRLTVQLRVDPQESLQPPEIHVEVTKGALARDARTRQLERIIAQSVQRDSNGIWKAQTFDGLRWEFDKGVGRWIKDKALAA
ncbi:MAG TPA: hypothetical protein VNX26_09675 [Candidatus Acidoferrum sp.]|nr:hypothetical protein [Candidatus Acidoferrum sp.]